MTRKTFSLTIILLLVAFLIQHIFIKQPDVLKRLRTAESFSDVEINLLGGGFEPVGYHQGVRPIVLIFWASGSDPCRLALEDLGKNNEEWKSKYDYEMIAINVGESPEKIESAKNLWNIGLKIGLDPDRKIAAKFGVGSLPTIIVLNKDGNMCGRWDRFDEDLRYGIRHRIEGEEENSREEKDTMSAGSADSVIAADSTQSEK